MFWISGCPFLSQTFLVHQVYVSCFTIFMLSLSRIYCCATVHLTGCLPTFPVRSAFCTVRNTLYIWHCLIILLYFVSCREDKCRRWSGTRGYVSGQLSSENEKSPSKYSWLLPFLHHHLPWLDFRGGKVALKTCMPIYKEKTQLNLILKCLKKKKKKVAIFPGRWWTPSGTALWLESGMLHKMQLRY